jgi:cellulase (glycosyl hydrolase family 5)
VRSRRATVLLLLVLTLTVALANGARAADRMWVGFTDDPKLRFDPDRQPTLDRVAASHATIVRTVVQWWTTAPTRPADATDPFDPAYHFDDLDELVRNAQRRGLEIEFAVWGTPSWANGGKSPQYAPDSSLDYQQFMQALASRYSGRYPGYPFVRFYGIWNESNLATFLRPQFDSAGNIVGPAVYAKLAVAGLRGVKAGNAQALVAIGETSSNGRNRHVAGLTDTVAPGTFLERVAKSAPRLKFDAWAQHPYPFPVAQPPTQQVRWPNVGMTSLPQLESALDRHFRKGIPIWITEYGNETKPGEPNGVTEKQQVVYLPQAIAIARRDPRVKVFVWFVFQDSTGSPWQSGLYRLDGSGKRSAGAWATAVAPLDMRNGSVTAPGGTLDPVVTVYLRDFCNNNGSGAAVGTTTRVFKAGKLVGITQAQLSLALDCTVQVELPMRVARASTYLATVDLNTSAGSTAQRTITVLGR